MPAMFGLMLLNADDDEDFEWFKFLQMYTRKSFLGWGPSYTIDLFMNLARIMVDKSFGPAQYMTKVFSPVMMLPIIEKTISGGAKGLDKLIIE